jgi:hypothetical protein
MSRKKPNITIRYIRTENNYPIFEASSELPRTTIPFAIGPDDNVEKRIAHAKQEVTKSWQWELDHQK